MSCCDFGDADCVDPCDEPCYDEVSLWTEEDVHRLVQLYAEQPALWNQDCPSYVSYDDRRAAYECIQAQLAYVGVSVLQVIVKIHEVRKLYVEELKNIAQAELACVCYEPRYSWFADLDEFLHAYLHVDEIEALEEVENDNCDEDELATALVRNQSAVNFCDRAQSSKPSCAASLPSFKKSSRSARKNCGALNCPANCARPAGTERSNGAPLQRGRSDPSGRSIAIVPSANQCEGPIKMSERAAEEDSPRSRLTARKSCDEFDLFAKSVACRLRRMSPDAAARARAEIQRVLTNVARDVEPNGSRAESENFDSEPLNNCKSPVVSIFANSTRRVSDSQESRETVHAVN